MNQTRVAGFWLVALLGGNLFAAAPPRPDGIRRDRYGDPLPAGAIARLGSLRLHNQRDVSHLMLSPDGRALATVDWKIRVWDTDTGRLLRDLGPLSSIEDCLGFLDGGKVLLTFDQETVRVHDLRTGRTRGLRLNAEGAWGEVKVAVAPNGLTLAVRFSRTEGPSQRDKLFLVEIATGRMIALTGTLEDFTLLLDDRLRSLLPLAFSSNGRHLAVGLGKTLRIYNVARNKEVAKIDLDGLASTIAWASDGQSIAVHRKDGSVVLASLKPPRQIKDLGVKGKSPSSLAFSADGKRLVFATEYGPVLSIDPSNKSRPSILIPQGVLPQCVLSQDGRRLAFLNPPGEDRVQMVRLWDLTPGRGRLLVPGAGNEGMLEAVPSPDGRRVATLAADAICIWDARTGVRLRRIAGKAFCPGLSWTPNGGELVAATGNKVNWWNANTGARLRQVTLPWRKVESVRLHSAGKKLLCSETDSSVSGTRHLVNAPAGELLTEGVRIAPGADLSRDGKQYVLWDVGHRARRDCLVITLIDRDTGLPSRKHFLAVDDLSPPLAGVFASITDKPFSTDCRFVVVPTGRGVQVWETATGRSCTPRPRGKRWLKGADGARITPDGRMAAVATKRMLSGPNKGSSGWSIVAPNSGLVLVEIATSQRRRLLPLVDSVSSIDFSADSRHLVTCGNDGTALVWDAYSERGSSGPLLAADARKLWLDLIGGDAGKAFEAICRLVASGKVAVDLIDRELKPAKVDRARLKRLLADLDADTYQARKAAEKQLADLGTDIEEDLRIVQQSKPSLEVWRRVERLLRPLREDQGGPIQWRRTRCLEVLERIGTSEALAVLKKLAAGAPRSRLTREARESLARLSRSSGIR